MDKTLLRYLSASGELCRIRWHDAELLLVGGAITTRQRFEAFTSSIAHIMPDGTIMRFGRIVGNVADIEFLDGEPAVDYTRVSLGALEQVFNALAGLPIGWDRGGHRDA